MKFSYDWLKDLVYFKESPDKIAELLTFYLAETVVSYRDKRPILEIDLLPNRVADVGGHLGLARELSAILGKTFTYPQPKLKESQKSVKKWLKVTIKSSDCLRYSARSLWHIKVKPSPNWLQERLLDCGLRPINNVVDATNYIMLLTGQPLHAFDFQKVAFNQKSQKEIIVRLAKKGEKFTTLDDKTYTLTNHHLLICDLEKPLALAGIKGGKKAEIDQDTSFLILESANFEGARIHLTSRELGLVTDASFRFEHQLDPALTTYALDLLAQLIQELAGGEILKGEIDEKTRSFSKIVIPLKFQEIPRYLGWTPQKTEVVKKLKLLGFNLKVKKDYWLINPPPYRTDLQLPQEVIAEVARLSCFDKIPTLPPVEAIKMPPKNETWGFINRIKDWLKDYQLEEVYTYSFLSEQDKDLLPSGTKENILELRNPLSDLYRYLRPTLMPNLLKAVEANFRFRDQVRFFEIGTVYQAPRTEQISFGGILARKEFNARKPLFYEAKGILEKLFEDLGLDPDDYLTKPLEATDQTYVENGLSFWHENKPLGIIGLPSSFILRHYDLKGEIVLWELDLLALQYLASAEREYQPLPQYPAARRDLSFIIKKQILIDTILKAIQNSSSYLEEVDLFDVYEEPALFGSENQSLSFHLIFRAPDRTLTNKEVEQEMSQIIKAVRKLGAEIR